MLALEVVDRRPRNIFGYRGGVDPITAPVGPKSPVPDAMRQVLVRVLNDYGFVVYPSTGDASLRVRVQLERLDYVARRRLWPTSVTTYGAVKLICDSGGQYYANRYTAKHTEAVKWAPSETANARFLNRTLSLMLERLLTDPELIERLSLGKETRAPSRPLGPD